MSNPPTGWAICDGLNGTPDLRGRFILGAGPNDAMGSVGGEREHILTVDEMPRHSHNLSLPQGDQLWNKGHGNTIWGQNYNKQFMTANEGNSVPHNNMPPFYVLAFLMKLNDNA